MFRAIGCVTLAGNLGGQRNKEMKEVRPLSPTLSATFSQYFVLENDFGLKMLKVGKHTISKVRFGSLYALLTGTGLEHIIW